MRLADLDYSGLIKPITEDILRIEIPVPHVLRNINLYCFRGQEPALIDAGPFHPLMAEAVLGALRSLGLHEISCLYLTHSHMDHSGMAAHLRRTTGARVAAHRLDVPRVAGGGERLRREHACFSGMCSRLGFPPEAAEAIFGKAEAWLSLIEPCPPDFRLGGGEEVRAGDRVLEVIHTPGHTAGHVCYYQREERLLFSGDHLMRSITPNPELYCPPRRGMVSGLPQFIESLRLLQGYEIRTAFPGHGDPIRQVRRRIEFNLLHHERRLEKTAEAVREGLRTVWEVALRLFPQVRDKPADMDHYLALKEALGHLVILEEMGEVRRLEENGVWKYLPT